jgi:hypothetical protein
LINTLRFLFDCFAFTGAFVVPSYRHQQEKTVVYYYDSTAPGNNNAVGVKETFIPSGLLLRENKYENLFGTFSGMSLRPVSCLRGR